MNENVQLSVTGIQYTSEANNSNGTINSFILVINLMATLVGEGENKCFGRRYRQADTYFFPLHYIIKHIGDEQNEARASSSFGGSQRERERESIQSYFPAKPQVIHSLLCNASWAEHSSSLLFFLCSLIRKLAEPQIYSVIPFLLSFHESFDLWSVNLFFASR